MNSENVISKDKNILIVLAGNEEKSQELCNLIENFCGTVIESPSKMLEGDLVQKKIYACGDISKIKDFKISVPFYVIREISYHFEDLENIAFVGIGNVPIVVCNAGVFFRRFFEDENDYFNQIRVEHQFQDLTESTKPGTAFRKGIYLTEVLKEITPEKNELLHYRLLRCSSNFSGPTENFRNTDTYIMNAMNEAVSYIFEKKTHLNHVLAQIYENRKADNDKEKKAKIKAHSDKTKDMPSEGLIAFCTFYEKTNFQHLKPSETDRFDWVLGKISGLTTLHFKLKSSVKDESLAKEFTVTLYPNSVFFIPLSTNRLYTHEIKPSILNIDKIPTRMGYVARCSNKEAVFMNNEVYIKENGELIKLQAMQQEGMAHLKETYRIENISEDAVEYGKIDFSMNSGDYQKPIF
jgi:hypothetical protein